MTRFVCLAVLALVAGCSLKVGNSDGPSAKGQSPNAPTRLSDNDLLRLERDANEKCRGGAGDEKATDKACADRDHLDGQLADAGYCYGLPTDTSAADSYWHHCVENGTSNMPAKLMVTVKVCEGALLENQTYRDSFSFGEITKVKFIQPNGKEVENVTGKLGADTSMKDMQASLKKFAEMTALTVIIPYKQVLFGTSPVTGTLSCDFTSDSEGGLGFKDYRRD